MTPETFHRVVALHKDADLLIAQYEDAATQEIARLALNILDQMQAAVASTDDIDALLNAIHTMLVGAENQAADVMVGMASGVWDVSLGTTVESLSTFGLVSPRVLASLAQTFNASYRAELLTAGHAEWYDKLSETALRPASALRESLIEVKARGGSVGDAVRVMLEQDPQLAELPLIDQPIALTARASRVVRTESTRVDNAVSVGFGEAAGAKTYANLGVGDTRQSKQCAIATKAKPLTIAEWRTFYSEGLYIGTAPRHVNCRCRLIGVPSAYEPSDQLLIEAGVLSPEEV